MELKYVYSQSNERPLEIDVTSSDNGVYIRRDIKETIVVDSDDNEKVFYNYQEAFLTKSEYEVYASKNIANKVNGIDDSQAFDNYQVKLDTPIEYPKNNFTYKVKWAETVYAGLLEKGLLLPDLFPLKIYDSTEEEDRAEMMSIADLTQLSMFLAKKQEEYFAEYKREKTQK